MKRTKPEVSRRDFLLTTGITAMGVPLMSLDYASAFLPGDQTSALSLGMKDYRKGANVRAVFVYPPSEEFSEDPDGWWSWPGTDFDAEGRQKQYTLELEKMEKKLGMTISVDDKQIANPDNAQRIAGEIAKDRPDGVLIVLFYNRSLDEVDLLLEAAETNGIPAIFYIGLGVKHGPITQYRRPGVYLIQSLDNFEAIEYGMRMINTKKLLSQSRLLRITDVDDVSEDREDFLGINMRTVPFSQYSDNFRKVRIDNEVNNLIQGFTQNAEDVHVTRESLENAARAHMAMKNIIREHEAHGVAMNCLQRGMLKPCVSFSILNGQLFAAACENDMAAACGLFLGEALTGHAGFQHNPAFETERNHYFGSHCTCSAKLHGPDGPDSPHILRKFLHSNEGSTAIQTFWKENEPVTMIHYYTGQPARLDIYSGKVCKSHSMPPVGGCATNVEIEITDRKDACEVEGHHNILFCGDFARRFHEFANLYKMNLG